MKIEGSLSMQLPQSYLGAARRQTSGFGQALARAAAPASMDQIFEEASRATGVSASLLKAVAKAESDFNPNCVSRCGAMGVMQLMPENVQTLGISDPFDPAQNIMGGAKHLRDMLDRYDGDPVLALAAYNAGPGNVNKYGGVPPFQETQNYVKKVMQYAGEELSVPALAQYHPIDAAQPGLPVSEALRALTGAAADAQDAQLLCNALRVAMQARLNNELNGQTEEEQGFL